ncbi:heme-dependent oxidative N-demethylase subunit alpha family protein [Hydrogenophaga flava]|uniref:heme-dependent oxidative N-demethylase subunit alpha family protein n=1 Tax=Hydrogenophaga flava TaxID=65657 RepID=UPI0012F7F87C|nr:heme-dependent oxidative N-demethylase subunit alpha family protein [Hydrogenophaga flava]
MTTPTAGMPWPVASPFRMRPGLARLSPATEAPPSPLFVRDGLASVYAAHKRAVLQTQHSLSHIGQADPAVLQAIAQAYAVQTGVGIAADARALAEDLQEDFVVLHDEPGDGFRARFLSVCFPSNWNPAEKLGLDFTAIHAPVADNALLQAGARGIVDMAFRQAPMLRHVWLLTPNGDLAQHPETRRARWEDALAAADAPGATGRLIDQVFFRVERQTTLPLPALQRGVFFIRVMVAPLVEVLAVAPGRAAELAEALASMSEAVVAYRGMAAVRERLCAELRPS